MNPTTPRELLDEWLIGVRSRLLSHFECAKRYDAWAVRLGVPTVIASSVVSVVSQASADAYPYAQTVTTCVSMLVTILTGVGTFLALPTLAEKHRTVANGLSVMRRDIETALVSGDITPEILDGFKKRWSELDTNSPSVPDHVYARHNCKIRQSGMKDVEQGGSVEPPPAK